MRTSSAEPRIAWLTLAAFFVQVPGLTPAARAATQGGAERIRMGISAVGVGYSADDERGVKILERRVQRWIENLETVRVEADILPSPLSPTQIRAEAAREGLMRALARLIAWLTREEGTGDAGMGEGLSAQLEAAQRELGNAPRFGLERQKALVAEAAYAWVRGDRTGAVRLLQRAARLGPEGVTDEAIPWELESHARLAGFSSHIPRGLGGTGPRPCHVSVDTRPAGAQLTVNGFPLGHRHEIQLPVGEFELEVSAAGHIVWSEHFTCARQQARHWKVELRPLPSGNPTQRATAIAARSHCLIAPGRDGLRLFLYTPEVGLDEIPLTRPLRLAQVLRDPGESALPIASDAFLNLVQKHRAPLLASLLPEPISPVVAPVASFEEVSPSPTRWYNDWRVWTIAGVVAGGIVTGILLSRDQTVQANHGASQAALRLKIE